MVEKNFFRLLLASSILLVLLAACDYTIINVDCNVPDLINAINHANANLSPSTLNLASGCTYSLTAVDNTATSSFEGSTFDYGDNGLPQITTPITINGNNATIVRVGDASDFRFFFITGRGKLTLNHLTLRNGFANKPGSAFPSSGGAIYNDGAYLEANDSTVENNQASFHGGAIFAIRSARTYINNSAIHSNTAPRGGGIFIYSGIGLLSIDNSEVSNNSATTSGGGISLEYGAEMIVTNSLIASNHAERHGGGIFKDAGSQRLPTTITGTTFRDNTADWSGGGVFIWRTPLTILDSLFINNQANEYGGGLGYQNNSTEAVQITNTTFDGNSALWDGGAIHFSGELLTLNNCTFQNNMAENGGGIHNGLADDSRYIIRTDTTFTINGSSLQENIAKENGGGVFNEGEMNTGKSEFLGNESATLGGGIYNTHEILVNGCTFEKNYTGSDGGGIYTEDHAVIQRSIFSSNTSTRGGGFANINGESEISDSTFKNNSVSDQGGAIFNHEDISGSSIMDIFSCEITDNSAIFGGGVATSMGDTTISESILSGNKAAKAGGGIYNDGMMTVSLSTLTGNEASTLGGGIHNKADISVEDSTFNNNLAAADGGGLNTYSTAMVSGSTFVGNTAFRGGGLASVGGVTVLTNDTFSANVAKDTGGGLFNMGALIEDLTPGGSMQTNHITVVFNDAPSGGGLASSGGLLKIKNSIVANNPSGSDCHASSANLISVSENIDSDGSCKSFTLTDDPFLDALANYGGPTETHALKPGSPAIDAAPDCTTVGGMVVSVDQRGQLRPGGALCDLGAYEDEAGKPAPKAPEVVFKRILDCHLEPASSSVSVTSFQPNEVADVVGRNINRTWYQVAPEGLENPCWVWVGGVEFIGDQDNVEIIPAKIPVEEEKPEEGKEPSPSQPGCTVRNPNGALVCQVPCPPRAVPGDPCTP